MSTKCLLAASATSKFLHDIATYINNRRIRQVLEVEGYQGIYECYAPIDKYNHPYNHCSYTGTYPENESLTAKGKTSLYSFEDVESFHPASKLYSHFIPSAYDASHATSVSPQPTSSLVTLEVGELFTQICASACLIRTGPKRGIFESVIPVFESFFRVKRDWLDECCEAAENGKGTEAKVMWVGMGENVGLKLRVKGRKVIGGGGYTGLRGYEEEPAVEYIVEYQCEYTSICDLCAARKAVTAKLSDWSPRC
ncbi:hypothetical protein ABW19_dt0201358 [Dactylella cylindrospora]|nr:hypothetical protein ABW19_dt0201358 [Dactylella cylindrospora]